MPDVGRRSVALALVSGVVLGGCSAGAGPAPDAPESSGTPGGEAVEYRPGRAATIDRPTGPPSSVVVLVPGGGWTTADPTGMAPLARVLSDGGHAVLTITYGVEATGDVYPVPLLDVACAVGLAAQEFPDLPVVLVGHSAGAHLAALTGLTPQVDDLVAEAPPEDPCPSAPASADAVVGLAGPYDIDATQGLAEPLVGAPATQDPETWAEANPLTWAAERPEVPFLLVHGDADTVVPPWFSERFAGALEDGGHTVELAVLTDVDHDEVYRPGALGRPLLDWLDRTLPGLGSTA